MPKFIEEYEDGQPVAVYEPSGSIVGIPCGFVLFADGASWCDDGVLACDYATHHPRHHLFGRALMVGSVIVCQRYIFAPAPAWHAALGSAWNSLGLTSREWIVVHQEQEKSLREERATFKR